MVTAISSTTDTTAASAAMKKSLGMNKDDFLKLFISQLKYQDPLAPQDATAMLNQLSQLTMVEQSYNTNTSLQSLLTAQNDSMSMNSVSFIGKTARANGNAIPFDGVTLPELQFNLPSAVTSGTIAITDASGQTVATRTFGGLSAGDIAFVWDGCDNSGTPLLGGAYGFSVTGMTSAGKQVAAQTFTSGRIDGVTLNNGKPMLTMGAVSVALTDIINVKGV